MEKITYPDDVTLFLDESRGTDIPRDFAILINKDLIIDREKWLPELDFLMKYDPYHDFYWETWDQILNHLKIKIGHRTYFFQQVSPGDVWMIRNNEKVRKQFFKSIE